MIGINSRTTQNLQAIENDDEQTLVVITNQYLCTNISKKSVASITRVYLQSTPCTRRNIPYHVVIVYLTSNGITTLLGTDSSLYSDFDNFKGEYKTHTYLNIGKDVGLGKLKEEGIKFRNHYIDI